MPDDVPIEDLATAGLDAKSVVRPVKLACIEPGRILRRIGLLRIGGRAVFDAFGSASASHGRAFEGVSCEGLSSGH